MIYLLRFQNEGIYKKRKREWEKKKFYIFSRNVEMIEQVW